MNREIGLLLNRKDVILETSFFGIKKKWGLGKMTLNRCFELTELYLKLKQDDEAIQGDDEEKALSALYYSIHDNAKTASKILATAIDSRIPRCILWRHLYKNVSSKELLKVVQKIINETNLANFSIAITGMRMLPITKPTEIA